MSSWPSRPPRPSSVPKWLLHHVLVITVLLSVASTKDLCDTKTNFGNLIHTIGVIDKELWAIAKDKNWTVYKLLPYKMHSNGTLDDSMIVSQGVSVESKWPQFSEAVKKAANKTDLDFAINDSLIMDSTKFRNTVIAMKSVNFTDGNGQFSYDFGANRSYTTYIHNLKDDVLISTDEKDKAYNLIGFGKEIQIITMDNASDNCFVAPNFTSTKNICNFSSTDQPDVQFQDTCETQVTWTVLKGVFYHSQYYFFASDKVYIFSDQATTARTKVLTVTYRDFLQCKQSTTSTMAPSTVTSPGNVTSAPVTEAITNGNKTMTSTKASNTTLILILVVISIVILVGVAIAVYCFCAKKNKDKVVPGSESALSVKQPQSKATSFLGASKLTSKAASQGSPKDSKRAAPKQSRSELNKKGAELKQKEKESDKDSYAAIFNMKIKSLDGFDLTPAKAAAPVASKKK